MLRCAQSRVLGTASLSLLDQTLFFNCFQLFFRKQKFHGWFVVMVGKGTLSARSALRQIGIVFWRRVRGEPCLLVFDELRRLFADVADGLEGQFAREIVRGVFGGLLDVGGPA